MNKLLKPILLATLILASALSASAYNFMVDGFAYNIINGSEASVTYTNYWSNNNYSGLTEANIPETITYNGVTYTVTSIGNSAFSRCSGLTSINIPNSITSIGEGAFSSCSGLTSVNIPNSVTSIGQGAFSNCSGMTSMTVDIDNTAFDSRDNCNAIIETATNTLIAGCKNTVIPNSVTSIGNSAFSGCSGMTSVNIPNSVTSIGNSAFSRCSGLTSVNIPNSVTSIGSSAFSRCSGLNNVNIPSSVTTISNNAFSGCSGLTSVNIPNSVTSIGDFAFSDCSGLTSVNIGNSVTSIGECAFLYCTSLTSVNIPNSVTSIAFEVFGYCNGLTSMTVDIDNTTYDSRDNCNAIIETATNTLIAGCKNTVIPNTVTTIGYFAFQGCSSLTSVNIPNSVTSIGYEAFQYCSGLTSINIPNSVTFITMSAFESCTSLRNLQFNAINCTIENYAFDLVNLSNLRFGEQVERIPANLPTFCMSEKALVLPNSVRVIDAGALRGSCDAVIIGDSIESIAEATFPNSISVAYISSTTPLPCANGAFANPQTLYVPQGCKGKYLMSDGWCEFANIVEGSYIRVTDLTLNVDSATMHIADTLQLNAAIFPEYHSATTLEWWSTNESVATVSPTGLVTAVAKGEADICCSVDNKTVICHISVVEKLVDSIVFNYTDLLLDWDNIVDLTATVYPENVDQSVTWTVPENDNIYARVVGNRLRVMAKRNGTVTVTATSVADPVVSADCVITIQIPDVNGDTSLNIADVTTLINYLLNSDENVIYVEDADVNRDGTITVTDVIALINKLLTH